MLLSIGVIASILLMNQIFEFIPFLQASGVELKAITQMILFSMPPILMIAIPISLMIGIYAGINRISSDYELVVMRASGVSLSYAFRPVLFVALIVAGVVMIQTFYLGPIGITRLEELKFAILKKQTKINLAVNRINNFFGKQLIYIFDKEGENYKGIFIANWDLAERDGVIEAESGIIGLEEERHRIVFHLKNGKLHYPTGKSSYRIIDFEQLDYDLTPPRTKQENLPQRFRRDETPEKEKLDTEMTIDELIRKIGQSAGSPEKYYEYVDEFHGRIVTILSCVCFAIFALPMGIYNPRSPKTGNIIYMIAVLVIYFLIFAQTRTMLVQGKLPPAALYSSLLFVIFTGLLEYLKINLNIDSWRDYFKIWLNQRKTNPN